MPATLPEQPDMSDALSMEATEPAAPVEGDLFGAAPEGMPELGEADETELDPLFAADGQDLFPDFDDEQLTKLQKLIDSRMHAGTIA